MWASVSNVNNNLLNRNRNFVDQYKVIFVTSNKKKCPLEETRNDCVSKSDSLPFVTYLDQEFQPVSIFCKEASLVFLLSLFFSYS